MNKTLFLLAALTASCWAQEPLSKDVQPLTKKEVATLDEARQAAQHAREELNRVEYSIKVAHGESQVTGGISLSVCGQTATTVELFGEFALITRTYWNNCAGPSPLLDGSTSLK